MIYGSGIDIIKVERVERLSKKDAFMNKLFTSKEREYLKDKGAESIAGYFSAKEAIVKAMGTGFRNFKFTDIEVLREESEPYVMLHGNAKKIAFNKGIKFIKVSISHEKEFAVANAIAVSNYEDSLSGDFLKYPLNIIKERKADSHKGTYGKVSIIGGSLLMPGSIILAANGALRAGCGLLRLVIPECILSVVSGSVYEATYKTLNNDNGTMILENKDINLILEESDAIAIGVGLGFKERLLNPIETILKKSKIPVVIDADGLNIISLNTEVLKRDRNCNVILTPHPLEMSRLTGLSVEYINSNREKVARDFSKEYNCIVLLKGNKTVIAYKDNLYINNTGNPGMATGGSGDVLTGIVCSLLGQGYSSYDSAVLGSHIHGLAGDMAYKEYGYGIKAIDITNYLGKYLK